MDEIKETIDLRGRSVSSNYEELRVVKYCLAYVPTLK